MTRDVATKAKEHFNNNKFMVLAIYVVHFFAASGSNGSCRLGT